MDVAERVYVLTNTFPKTEQYGLVNQMRRSAVSIPANIAEGYARKHRAEYIQFLRIAFGSGAELETYFELVPRLALVKNDDILTTGSLHNEVMRMLNKLIASLVVTP